jgi:hypothetical protein
MCRIYFIRMKQFIKIDLDMKILKPQKCCNGVNLIGYKKSARQTLPLLQMQFLLRYINTERLITEQLLSYSVTLTKQYDFAPLGVGVARCFTSR